MNYTLLQNYYRNDDGLTLGQIILIILGIFAAYSLFRGSRMIKTVLSHWHHRFETMPFSPQEFYQAVESKMTEKGIKHVSVSRIDYPQGGLLSPKREYLRITYQLFIYDICAAPFAKEFFVSWWMGEQGDHIRDFFINLPVIGKFFTKRKKTFFELDTEIMFKEAVSSCVREVIETLVDAKGIRKLSEAEWRSDSRHY